MRLVNPFAFDIDTALIKLSELFSTHGSCPASNDVTWSPWKAGKTMYQMWNVTPNKAGLIKSATPTLTLDGEDYLGLFIYLLSLADYTKAYTNKLDFIPSWNNLAGASVSGAVSDFIPVNLGEIDFVNMTGIFYNINVSIIAWASIKSWVEAGNIWVESLPTNITPATRSRKDGGIGDFVTCVVNEPELSPIYNKPATLTAAIDDMLIISVADPAGWTHRTLFEANIGGVAYDHIVEMTHTASGGKVIFIGGCAGYYPVLAGWWYPLLLFQYPMMKFAGVSAYYTE